MSNNNHQGYAAFVQSANPQLWVIAPQEQKTVYLCAALAEFCHATGLQYNVLREIVGTASPIDDMLTKSVPLTLAVNDDEDAYVITGNPVIGECLLKRISRAEPNAMLAAFLDISHGIASQVNRRAIIARSPEAILAGRLFDSDRVVKPLLGDRAGLLFVRAQVDWEWNSRYWGQRALLAAEEDLDLALQYARQGVAIEQHSLTQTTLGMILLRHSQDHLSKRDTYYAEAFDCLAWAIDWEQRMSRPRANPFRSLFRGTLTFLKNGGCLSKGQVHHLRRYIGVAQYRFRNDTAIQSDADAIVREVGAA